MPKIIENLESRLVEEAKRQIEKSGYQAVTIRSVAKGCGVGVGTVYNYFSSKDELLANYLLRDWYQSLEDIQRISADANRADVVVRCIYDQLRQYARQHLAVFQDETAAASYAGSFSRHHALLRSQLAQQLRKFCGSDFAAEFIVESLLTWTMAGKRFDEIYGMIEKLL